MYLWDEAVVVMEKVGVGGSGEPLMPAAAGVNSSKLEVLRRVDATDARMRDHVLLLDCFDDGERSRRA